MDDGGTIILASYPSANNAEKDGPVVDLFTV
jgi:hypothetical protein